MDFMSFLEGACYDKQCSVIKYVPQSLKNPTMISLLNTRYATLQSLPRLKGLGKKPGAKSGNMGGGRERRWTHSHFLYMLFKTQ